MSVIPDVEIIAQFFYFSRARRTAPRLYMVLLS